MVGSGHDVPLDLEDPMGPLARFTLCALFFPFVAVGIAYLDDDELRDEETPFFTLCLIVEILLLFIIAGVLYVMHLPLPELTLSVIGFYVMINTVYTTVWKMSMGYFPLR